MVVLLTAVLRSFDLAGAWPDPLPALLRNLAGFLGLALLKARLVGARLSWTVPVAFAMFAYLTARKPDNTLQPGQDVLSWTVTFLLFAAGFGLACLHGVRQPAGETE